jgi:hypothetical protein
VRVIPLIVIAEDPLLVSVAAFAAPVFPMLTVSQLITEGLTEAVPPVVLVPVPESATVCGLLLEVSETDSVAALAPLVLGLNVTETVQLADAARLVPQVLLEMLKSPGVVPPSVTLFIVTDELVLFFSVAVCEALVDPTFSDPNESDVELKATDPFELVGANPDNAVVCGLGLAESLKFRVAVKVPPVVGAKAIFAVQLDPAARLDPHVLDSILNCAAPDPVSATLLMVIALDPLLVSVTTFCAPTLPTSTDAQLKLVGDVVAANAVHERTRQKAATVPALAQERRRNPKRRCSDCF